jgi:hypothetical protein
MLEQVLTPDEEHDPYPLYDSDFTEEELMILKHGNEVMRKIMETGNRIVRDGPSTSQGKQAWEQHSYSRYPVEHIGFELLSESEKEAFNKAAKLQVHRRNTKYNLWRSSRRSIH